ncbi:MAG TPA: response regulator [Vicinamibacteria bacterium]|nr:response regulator [Vicinamibacteria bacterium]
MSEVAEPKRILVVDDEEDVQILVSRILRDAGYEVDRASDGKQAIDRLDASMPDLIVLDLMMPVVDGWGVLQHLQTKKDSPPVVIVTARTDYATFARGIREGGTAFVCKPFRFHELVATCQRLLLPGTKGGAFPGDRRGNARRMLMVEVKVLSRDRAPIALGELVNLGPGGAQVELGVPLEVGDLVRVAFHIPGGETPLSLGGQVRWRSPAPRGFSLGVGFQDLSPLEERQLAELLKNPR